MRQFKKKHQEFSEANIRKGNQYLHLLVIRGELNVDYSPIYTPLQRRLIAYKRQHKTLHFFTGTATKEIYI